LNARRRTDVRLRKASHAPTAKKRFGQHFLQAAWVSKLVTAIGPKPSDVFLEVGPGPGALTRPLAAASRHIVAFEIDRDLAATLRRDAPPNVTLVEGDFLDVTADALRRTLKLCGIGEDEPLRVAGNLPYNVASPILFKLVEFFQRRLPIADATVMLQREVADRLLAKPGTKEYGVLTVLIGQWAEPERRFALPPGAFRPAPKVHSAVVTLRFRPPSPRPLDSRTFSGLVQAVFTRRRKTIANALAAFPQSRDIRPVPALEAAGIDPRRRPETLSGEEFVRLADAYARQESAGGSRGT